MLVLSWREAEQLLGAKGIVRLNIGMDIVDVIREQDSFLFPKHEHLSRQDTEKIAENKTVCFMLKDNETTKIQLFAQDTNRFYKLYPTADWPTLEISGVRMHRVTQVTPKKDTEMKIALVSPVEGVCLDTCTGLGYTAIGLVHAGATKVVTIEKDHNCQDVARYNPWSQELFSLNNIERINGDVSVVIKSMKSNYFNRIIHDPPSFSLAGELYSLEFYKQLYRVLKKEGKLFHYTGRPGAVRSSRNLLGEASKRLTLAGFHVKRHEDALGVVGVK